MRLRLTGPPPTREAVDVAKLRQARLEAANRYWPEIAEPVERHRGWLIDVESDRVFRRKPGIVFWRDSATAEVLGVDCFFVDRDGDVVPLERVASVETWSEFVAQREEQRLKRGPE